MTGELCRKGLHEKVGPGRCVECQRASRRRYNTSEKGRATQARYRESSHGQEMIRLYDNSDARREATRRHRQQAQGQLIPAGRVRELVSGFLERTTVTQLERDTGLAARQIYAIVSGERKWVQLRTVDAILCGMDRPDLWHTELADIYEDTDRSVYNLPVAS